MAGDTPRKNDIVVREKRDGSWTVVQDGAERLASAGAGIHLVDRDRAQETADDIASFEQVDLWVFENGQYALLKSYRGVVRPVGPESPAR